MLGCGRFVDETPQTTTASIQGLRIGDLARWREGGRRCWGDQLGFRDSGEINSDLPVMQPEGWIKANRMTISTQRSVQNGYG